MAWRLGLPGVDPYFVKEETSQGRITDWSMFSRLISDS